MTIQAEEAGPFDTPKEHTFELKGATVIAQRRDPYGFFHLHQEKGTLPARYTGVYTSVFEVERAMREYQAELNLKPELHLKASQRP